jgi:molybdopterin molybdotransferase
MNRGFFQVVSPDEFIELLHGFPTLAPETEELKGLAGRVLAGPVTSPEDLPPCDRSSMDGYAVQAKDTFGASESNPAYLDLVGEAAVNDPPSLTVGPGQCVALATGSCLPHGADAVVMIEQTETMGGGVVEIRKAAAPRENVMLRGEDATSGQEMLGPGVRLRFQEIGLLAALGVERAEVVRVPRAAIISTGDELVPVHETPSIGQIRDVNTHALAAMVTRQGFAAAGYGLVPDELDPLVKAIEKGMAEADVVFLSGGSSVGVRDLTVAAIEHLGGDILAHGVQVSPGKPTILARVSDKPVIGLPGQVASAQVVMRLFGLPFLAHLEGEAQAFTNRFACFREAELSRNLASKQGREDWVRVGIEETDGKTLAVPRLGKSGLLRTMLAADGLVRIPSSSEGLLAGSAVRVYLLR